MSDRKIAPPPSAARHRIDHKGHISSPGWGALVRRARGRGAVSNASGRFETRGTIPVDDGWRSLEDIIAPIRTEIIPEAPRKAITYNQSPDISFDRTINPYKGCEHGCIYCYARPNHAFAGLSAGVDFETKIFAKRGLIPLLETELSKPRYRPRTIVLGGDTDVYQPIERELKITRAILEVLAKSNHPVALVTKSALVLRDLDLLAPMAAKGLARVAISLTSLDSKLSRKLEPRASAPHKRLEMIHALANSGVPVTVMTAPIIPAINDMELESLLSAAAQSGASSAGYVLLRLPHETAYLFEEWLDTHFPDRKSKVMAQIRAMRGGANYQSEWRKRQRGQGPYADLIAQRFEKACVRVGLDHPALSLRTDLFTPNANQQQMQWDLFEDGD